MYINARYSNSGKPLKLVNTNFALKSAEGREESSQGYSDNVTRYEP